VDSRCRNYGPVGGISQRPSMVAPLFWKIPSLMSKILHLSSRLIQFKGRPRMRRFHRSEKSPIEPDSQS
jgi:hypothetical protein